MITTDPFSILAEQKRFYQELYESRNNNNTEGMKTIEACITLSYPHPPPVLTEEQKWSCEGAISPEECTSALDSFQNNKAPGNDGIPIEFYRKFWPIIGESFSKCAIVCFQKGEMSVSQKQAIITLIEKKGKDRSLLENWRPISLLNVDAKIFVKSDSCYS